MTVIKIQGGIGNQLYQYAFLVSLQRRHINTTVDLSFYRGEMRYPRESLNLHLNLNVIETSGPRELNLFSKLYKKFSKTRLRRYFYILNERFGNVIVEEQEYGYSGVIHRRNLNGVYLCGYFQDFRYLQDGVETVKAAFKELTGEIDLEYTNYVAVHIRRGDYTKIMRNEGKSNVLDIEYYVNCLKILDNKNFILRIYTDDYEWAKVKLPEYFKGYCLDFSPKQFNDIDSLWTMSSHNYLIGANSTYSIWAYYFGIDDMENFFFPKDWANSIESKGYMLFGMKNKNLYLIEEPRT
jgi:hypothetical protein